MIIYHITFLLHVIISYASEEEVCTTWEPFSFTEGGEDELQQFANFQNLVRKRCISPRVDCEMLSNENIPCELKRAVIFRANAGFGKKYFSFQNNSYKGMKDVTFLKNCACARSRRIS